MANPKRASLAELLTPSEAPVVGQGSGTAPADDRPTPEARSRVLGKAPADFARVGLYLPPRVAKEIKMVAFTHDRKAHDVYLEAVDLVLRKYGRASIKELSTKE